MCAAFRFSTLVVLGIGSCLAFGSTNAGAQKQDAPPPARVQLVRQMYEKVPPLIFDVVEPVQLVKATMYEDGGTIVVELKDAKGKHFATILDRKFGSPTRESMFVFSVPFARTPVLLRGPEEAALYGVLLRWKATKDTEPWTRESARAMLEHLDQRFAALPPAKTKDAK
jgi:hypothetical protein